MLKDIAREAAASEGADIPDLHGRLLQELCVAVRGHRAPRQGSAAAPRRAGC